MTEITRLRRRAKTARLDSIGVFLPVTWSYLARLDEVPCDIFLRVGRRPVLYATTGANPETLREKAIQRVPMVVREADSYLLRRMLTVSLGRTLSDQRLSPTERSREAYGIAATIVGETLKTSTKFDADEATLAEETIDLLTRTLSEEDDTLWAMVASMQRNLVTHNHAINIAIYSLALAKRNGIADPDQLRDIGRGALLADIGLTTVPTRVLDNPNDLDPQEARALRMHPAVGYAIVTRAIGEAPPYAHIILEHHERLDGSGYPAGRKASQIALDAQIVAIADTYDTLTTVRPGQVALTAFQACQEMRFARLGQFNSELTGEFIELLGGWTSIRVA
jgi:HD-GYP domain-containing protein (c-di-GMP phosphodiesterase class II)